LLGETSLGNSLARFEPNVEKGYKGVSLQEKIEQKRIAGRLCGGRETEKGANSSSEKERGKIHQKT